MRSLKKISVRIVVMLLLMAMMLPLVQPLQVHAATNAKIHFLTLPANNLAVLVECNGWFGMIDSGEDTDYPTGSNSRYPARAGITKSRGYEKEVIAYLKSVGVTKNNFQFYIGTHPHSDHIGSADEVIREFKPKRVYIQEYKDSYITDSTALWDNLYIYDRMVQAAKDVGATLIQKITSSNAVFTLGDGMKISIKNYGEDYKAGVPDANYFSLGVLVEANGKSAFVSGDINNFAGDENAMRKELGHVDILTLGHHGHYGSNSNAYVTGLTPKMLILPGDYSGVSSNALPNDKSCIDTLLEMGKKGVPLYATAWYTNEMGAIVVNFNSSLSTNIPANSVKTVKTTNTVPAMSITYKKGIPVSTTALSQWIQEGGRWWYRHPDGSYTRSDWEKIDGKWYYFDASGWMVTGWIQLKGVWYYLDKTTGAMATGWNTIGGQKYYFDSEGAMKTGWQQIGGKWYYLNADGAMQTGWIQLKRIWYYLNPSNGVMATGWNTIGGKVYYFDASGAMKTGWLQLGSNWYYLDASGARVTGWLKLGNTWYYMYSNGVMACNTWVDGCYLNSSGAWVQ